MQVVVDYSYDATLRSLDQSMQRLGLPKLDIVMIHDVDSRSHPAPGAYAARFAEAMKGAYRALQELRAQGAIRAVGIGLHELSPCMDFAAAGDFDCFMLAGRYTLLDQSAAEEVLPVCEKKNISLIVAGPYNSGILATGAIPGAQYHYADAPDAILRRVAEIQAIADEFEVPLAAAALQFPLLHRHVASVVVGVVSEEEVKRNLAFIGHKIPAEFWTCLKDEGLLPNYVPIVS
jgi:D-threo-aldose 1-dehydrogenase